VMWILWCLAARCLRTLTGRMKRLGFWESAIRLGYYPLPMPIGSSVTERR